MSKFFEYLLNALPIGTILNASAISWDYKYNVENR